MLFNRGREISPCIVSKVRHALTLKTIHPQNNKTCSLRYWIEVCETIGSLERKTEEEIQIAIDNYRYYMALR
jgi:hypothetical protein